MNQITINFGKNLKKYRKNKNLSQEKLSGIIEINWRQIARIEAGESFVTAETLCKICSTLDIQPAQLFE